jgi:hypothetical protein
MIKMNIYEALKNVTTRKREYFKWKFDLRYDQRLPKKSEEEFLRFVQLKSFNSLLEWEKTEEYRNLLSIYLSTKFDHDLEEIYNSLSEKAKSGDEKSIRLLLQLGKEIKEYSRQAEKQLQKAKNDDEDDLIL